MVMLAELGMRFQTDGVCVSSVCVSGMSVNGVCVPASGTVCVPITACPSAGGVARLSVIE